jgi:hypothetical protein
MQQAPCEIFINQTTHRNFHGKLPEITQFYFDDLAFFATSRMGRNSWQWR